MKVLIAPDKFKGTLSAEEAAQAIAEGWSRTRKSDSLVRIPICDGGDGFGPLMGGLIDGIEQNSSAVNAAGEPCQAPWWWSPQASQPTAVIESAGVIGLAMLEESLRHPLKLDTRGLGMLIKDAVSQGAESCLVGIGGSATNDGGFGMARELGWQFLDAQNSRIQNWAQLHELDSVIPPDPQAFEGIEFVVAVDVENPLLGPLGCSRIYGPQKGLKESGMAHAERCLNQLATVMEKHLDTPLRDLPGAGAAGGLGFGLRAFCGARFENGFQLFARYAELEQQIKNSDLVLTGEGSIDASSIMGKCVGQILQMAGEIPVIGLGGSIGSDLPESERQRFKGLYSLSTATSLENALKEPHHWLAHIAEAAATSVMHDH